MELTFVTTLISLIIAAKLGMTRIEPADLSLIVALLLRLTPSVTKIKQASNVIVYHTETIDNFVKNLGKIHDPVNISLDKKQLSVLHDLNDFYGSKKQFVLLGKSGTGKTTILDVIVGNKLSHSLPKSYQPQDYFYGTQFVATFSDTFWPNVDLNMTQEKLHMERVVSFLNQMGMKDIMNKNPKTYSGGELKVLSICRLLYLNASNILLDEPTTGLDPNLERLVLEYLANFLSDKTFVIVMHNHSNILTKNYQVISL